MSLPYELQMIVLIVLGTLVFVGTLISLRSAPLFQPRDRVVVAFCTSILSVIGLSRFPESNVPEANGVISGILILYAALAVAMFILLLLLLLRRWSSRAAGRDERHGRFDLRADVSNPKMNQED